MCGTDGYQLPQILASRNFTRAVSSCQFVAASCRVDRLNRLRPCFMFCKTRPRFGRRWPQMAGHTATSRSRDKTCACNIQCLSDWLMPALGIHPVHCPDPGSMVVGGELSLKPQCRAMLNRSDEVYHRHAKHRCCRREGGVLVVSTNVNYSDVRAPRGS